MSTFIPDVSDANNAGPDLALHSQVPLLGVRKVVGVGGTVVRSAGAVIGSQANVRGRAIGREAFVEVERRLISTQRIAKAELRIESIQ